jgi:hypothetical protein
MDRARQQEQVRKPAYAANIMCTTDPMPFARKVNCVGVSVLREFQTAHGSQHSGCLVLAPLPRARRVVRRKLYTFQNRAPRTEILQVYATHCITIKVCLSLKMM